MPSWKWNSDHPSFSIRNKRNSNTVVLLGLSLRFPSECKRILLSTTSFGWGFAGWFRQWHLQFFSTGIISRIVHCNMYSFIYYVLFYRLFKGLIALKGLSFAHYVSFKAASMKSKRSWEMLEIQKFSHTNLLSFGFFIKTNQAAHFWALVSSAGEKGGEKKKKKKLC